jgi:hypothetical protein
MEVDIGSLKKNKSVESIIQFGSSIKKKTFRDIDLCIFTFKKLGFKEKLKLMRDLPEKYDISFYSDLPLNLKKVVLSEGKILFTRNYLNVLRRLAYVDLEYPRYASFLKDYHSRRMMAI